jgi:multicomponent Na+:H+ antiporter subunit C
VSTWFIYVLAGVLVLGIGVRALFAHRRLLGKIIAANVTSSGVFLIFVALARRTPDGEPDPVPHALVLTGIVVSVSATALALAITRRLAEGGQPAALNVDDPEGPSG